MMMMKHIGPHERMFAEALLRSTLNMMCVNCYQPERQCEHCALCTRMIRHDTIRDAILTCARKPTRVSLIYRTETTTKKCKTEKPKSKKRICSEVIVKVWEIRVVSPEEVKNRLRYGKDLQKKECFKPGLKE